MPKSMDSVPYKSELTVFNGFTAKRVPWHPTALMALYLHGQDTGLRLNGDYIVAAYGWQGHYLLILNEYDDYESGLSIYMIDQRLCIVDHAGAGWCAPGELKGLQLVPPDRILFRLPRREWLWSIKLLEKPKWRLPLSFPGLSDPWPVMRLAGGHQKYFEITLLDRPPLR